MTLKTIHTTSSALQKVILYADRLLAQYKSVNFADRVKLKLRK